MPDPSRRRPRPARVLVLEDDPIAGPALARLMSAAGYRGERATTVADARSAIATSAGDRFAAIVADLMLPDGLGWDAFDDSRDAGVGVVLAMTAGDPELLAEARRRGASAVLRKPFDADALVALLPPP